MIEEWQLNVGIEKCELLHIGYHNENYPYSIENVAVPPIKLLPRSGHINF